MFRWYDVYLFWPRNDSENVERRTHIPQTLNSMSVYTESTSVKGKNQRRILTAPSIFKVIRSLSAVILVTTQQLTASTTAWCRSWTRLRGLVQPTPTRPEAHSSSLTRHDGDQMIMTRHAMISAKTVSNSVVAFVCRSGSRRAL